MLLAPLFFDQADNAQRAPGVVRVIEFRRYSAAGAFRELEELLANPGYSRRAAEIGARIDAEDGVAIGVRADRKRDGSRKGGKLEPMTPWRRRFPPCSRSRATDSTFTIGPMAQEHRSLSFAGNFAC